MCAGWALMYAFGQAEAPLSVDWPALLLGNYWVNSRRVFHHSRGFRLQGKFGRLMLRLVLLAVEILEQDVQTRLLDLEVSRLLMEKLLLKTSALCRRYLLLVFEHVWTVGETAALALEASLREEVAHSER